MPLFRHFPFRRLIFASFFAFSFFVIIYAAFFHAACFLFHFFARIPPRSTNRYRNKMRNASSFIAAFSMLSPYATPFFVDDAAAATDDYFRRRHY